MPRRLATSTLVMSATTISESPIVPTQPTDMAPARSAFLDWVGRLVHAHRAHLMHEGAQVVGRARRLRARCRIHR